MGERIVKIATVLAVILVVGLVIHRHFTWLEDPISSKTVEEAVTHLEIQFYRGTKIGEYPNCLYLGGECFSKKKFRKYFGMPVSKRRSSNKWIFIYNCKDGQIHLEVYVDEDNRLYPTGFFNTFPFHSLHPDSNDLA